MVLNEDLLSWKNLSGLPAGSIKHAAKFVSFLVLGFLSKCSLWLNSLY